MIIVNENVSAKTRISLGLAVINQLRSEFDGKKPYAETIGKAFPLAGKPGYYFVVLDGESTANYLKSPHYREYPVHCIVVSEKKLMEEFYLI